jgi:hypothetical protein
MICKAGTLERRGRQVEGGQSAPKPQIRFRPTTASGYPFESQRGVQSLVAQAQHAEFDDLKPSSWHTAAMALYRSRRSPRVAEPRWMRGSLPKLRRCCHER